MSNHPLFTESSQFSRLATSLRLEGKLIGYFMWQEVEVPRQEPELLLVPASDPANLLNGSFKLQNAYPTLGIEICFPPGAGKHLLIFLFAKEMVAKCLQDFGIETISEMFREDALTSKEAIVSFGLQEEMASATTRPLKIAKGFEVSRYLSAVPFFTGTLDAAGRFVTEMQLGDILPLSAQYLIAVIDV